MQYSVWIQLPKEVNHPNLLVGHFDNAADAFDAAEIIHKNGNEVILEGPGNYTNIMRATIIG